MWTWCIAGLRIVRYFTGERSTGGDYDKVVKDVGKQVRNRLDSFGEACASWLVFLMACCVSEFVSVNRIQVNAGVTFP